MPVQSIYDLKASCELDPTRVSDARELAGNAKRLQQHTMLVWNSLLHAAEHVPQPLRCILANLRSVVAQRFPGNETAASSAVVGFFFLRLICPALLGPQLFGLQVRRRVGVGPSLG